MEGSGLPRTLTKCRDLHRSGWKIRRISVWLEQLYKIGKALKKKRTTCNCGDCDASGADWSKIAR